MARGRTDAIIAGVNKAGTTSLFVSLSTHPDVAPSSIKETRFFLPARYGQPLPPAAEWDAFFADAGSSRCRAAGTERRSMSPSSAGRAHSAEAK